MQNLTQYGSSVLYKIVYTVEKNEELQNVAINYYP